MPRSGLGYAWGAKFTPCYLNSEIIFDHFLVYTRVADPGPVLPLIRIFEVREPDPDSQLK